MYAEDGAPSNNVVCVRYENGRCVEMGGEPFKVGQRVAGMLPLMHTRWGACAQLVAVSAAHIAVVPDAVSLQDAAALPLTALTVTQGLSSLGAAALAGMKGKRALVQAGAGGVGTFATQWLGSVLGMDVSATSSKHNLGFLRDTLGVKDAIDYRARDVLQEGGKFDLVIDPMSYMYEEDTLRQGGKVLANDGHAAYINILGSDWALDAAGKEKGVGPVTFANWARYKACALLRTVSFGFLGGGGGGDREGDGDAMAGVCGNGLRYELVFVNPNGGMLAHVLEAVAQGRVKAVVDKTFKLKDAAAAFDYLELGHARGKVLLDIPVM
jgi:alcohol dehydrogenase